MRRSKAVALAALLFHSASAYANDLLPTLQEFGKDIKSHPVVREIKGNDELCGKMEGLKVDIREHSGKVYCYSYQEPRLKVIEYTSEKSVTIDGKVRDVVPLDKYVRMEVFYDKDLDRVRVFGEEVKPEGNRRFMLILRHGIDEILRGYASDLKGDAKLRSSP